MRYSLANLRWEWVIAMATVYTTSAAQCTKSMQATMARRMLVRSVVSSLNMVPIRLRSSSLSLPFPRIWTLRFRFVNNFSSSLWNLINQITIHRSLWVGRRLKSRRRIGRVVLELPSLTCYSTLSICSTTVLGRAKSLREILPKREMQIWDYHGTSVLGPAQTHTHLKPLIEQLCRLLFSKTYFLEASPEPL